MKDLLMLLNSKMKMEMKMMMKLIVHHIVAVVAAVVVVVGMIKKKKMMMMMMIVIERKQIKWSNHRTNKLQSQAYHVDLSTSFFK